MTTKAELYQKARAFLFRRQRSYQLVFGSRDGERVLADLAAFCRADVTEFHPDPRVHAALSGRREVFLRIQQHIQLSPETLAQLRGIDNE